MLSATFHNWGGGPHQVHGHFPTPEILYIIHRNRYTSQGDPDFSFPYLITDKVRRGAESLEKVMFGKHLHESPWCNSLNHHGAESLEKVNHWKTPS